MNGTDAETKLNNKNKEKIFIKLSTFKNTKLNLFFMFKDSIKAYHAMMLYLTSNRKPSYISHEYLSIVKCRLFDVYNNAVFNITICIHH